MPDCRRWWLAGGGRSANRTSGADGADRVVFVVHEEEELVLLDGAAEGAAETVVIETGMQRSTLHGVQLSAAFRSRLNIYSYSDPWNWLVPLLTT